jgi:hypothetical protein
VQLADTTQAKHPTTIEKQDMITDPDETDFPAADLAERSTTAKAGCVPC